MEGLNKCSHPVEGNLKNIREAKQLQQQEEPNADSVNYSGDETERTLPSNLEVFSKMDITFV